MSALELANDNGFASRKFWLVCGALLVVAAVAVLSATWPAIQAVYVVFTGSVLGLVGMYFGVNAGVKYLATKNGNGK